MQDRDLRQRLEGIFSSLNDDHEDRASALMLLDEAQPGHRLSGLFSSMEEFAPPIVEQAVQLLKSRQVKERRRAVQRLSQLQNPWVVTPLLQAVADKDPEVAQLALAALLKLGEPVDQQVAALLKLPSLLLQADARGCVSYLLGQLMNYIPPGPFSMGSHLADDPMANPDEQPRHTLPLAGYWIARHPVTTAQFKRFILEAQYQPRNAVCIRGEADHPVVHVTWTEAMAYCQWLSRQTGLDVTLPSEAEWEKAARGSDGRLYPWGDELPPDLLTQLQELMPVGAFSPQTDSPYACADMGSVWEWSRSLYRPYPYRPEDGRESPDGDEERVIRGVTFNESSARCAFRYHLKPDLPLPTLGFRIAVLID